MSLWSAIALEVGGVSGEVETTADPTSIRILSEGYLLLIGPVRFVLVALIGQTSVYVIFSSDAFPRGTGRRLAIVTFPALIGRRDEQPHSPAAPGPLIADPALADLRRRGG